MKIGQIFKDVKKDFVESHSFKHNPLASIAGFIGNLAGAALHYGIVYPITIIGTAGGALIIKEVRDNTRETGNLLINGVCGLLKSIVAAPFYGIEKGIKSIYNVVKGKDKTGQEKTSAKVSFDPPIDTGSSATMKKLQKDTKTLKAPVQLLFIKTKI